MQGNKKNWIIPSGGTVFTMDIVQIIPEIPVRFGGFFGNPSN